MSLTLCLILASCGGENTTPVEPIITFDSTPATSDTTPTTSQSPLETYYASVPDSASDETPEGNDINEDGIRDDIEEYISIAFTESDNARTFAKSLAKQTQEILINSSSVAPFILAEQNMLTAECLSREIEVDEIRRVEILKAEILNNCPSSYAVRQISA